MALTVVLITAYLLGSIPTSYLVVERLTSRDIRTMGSGNPGTMNVWDTVGFRAALIVGLGDIAKGIAAVAIAYLVGLGNAGAVAAAICAVVGHDWSIFLRGDGGNGTAPAVGGMIGLFPVEGIIATSVAIAMFPVVRSRRIAGIVGLVLLPALAYWAGGADVKLIGVLLLLAFTALKIIRSEGFSTARPGQ